MITISKLDSDEFCKTWAFKIKFGNDVMHSEKAYKTKGAADRAAMRVLQNLQDFLK